MRYKERSDPVVPAYPFYSRLEFDDIVLLFVLVHWIPPLVDVSLAILSLQESDIVLVHLVHRKMKTC